MNSGTYIESVGIEIPERTQSTSAILEKLGLPEPLKLELMTGIRSRHVCSEHEDSLTLALGAGKNCMEHSTLTSGDIDMVIYCGISRYVGGVKHAYEPAMSLMIKDRLGLKHAMAFDISNACAGMLTGIHIASEFIENGTVGSCLVVSGEYITSLSKNALVNIKSPRSKELASLTLGDAGGAVILKRSNSDKEKILVSKFVTLGQYSDLCIGYMSKRQEGGVMLTRMKQIHDASIQHAPLIIEEALGEAGLSLDEIDHLIPHQTSRQAIKAGEKHFREYFGTMARNIVVNLENVGNTASTSHVLAFHNLLRNNKIRQGEKIMLLSFASGLVIGVVIFTVSSILDRYGS